MHDAGAASVGKELGTVAEQPARGNSVEEADHSLPRILHLQHPGAPRPELLDDDPKELLRDIDRELLIRLESLAVRTLAGDDSGT